MPPHQRSESGGFYFTFARIKDSAAGQVTPETMSRPAASVLHTEVLYQQT